MRAVTRLAAAAAAAVAVAAVPCSGADAGAAVAVAAAVDAARVTNGAVNKRWMGCHSDFGFNQTPRGFTSNILYGSSFENGTMAVPAWGFTTNAPGNVTYGLQAGQAFNSKASMGLAVAAGAPAGAEVGAVNRGMGGTGLALAAGKPYTVTVFLWSGANCTAFVELRDFRAGTSLARQEFTAVSTGPPWGSTWLPYTLTLTPSAGTACVEIPYGSDPTIDCGVPATPAHVCVNCGGEFVVGVTGAGAAVNVGFVSVSPGPWGLLTGVDGTPLPVLKSAADALTAMGITVIRSGGSAGQAIRWSDWRGAVWSRPSQQQVWYDSLLSGWGPFEVVDMCAALGIQPVLTMAYDTNDALAWADLVEYCWGDASTSWGGRRVADGHLLPYNVTAFELGNEQYNPNWVDQVAAMEARAAAVGAPPLQYLFPTNTGLTAADAARALAARLPVERIMPDIHVQAGGAVELAAALFAAPPVPGFNQSAINCETNADTHDMGRALDEAADLIDYFTYDAAVTSRIYARTASFCTGTSNGYDLCDQAMSTFLPDQVWLQPPGYVHAMITATWADVTVAGTVTTPNVTLPFAAQLADGGSTLVLRAVNYNASAVALTVTVSGGTMAGATASLSTLSAPNVTLDNPPSAPTAISPAASTTPLTSPSSVTLPLPPFAFVVATVPFVAAR